MTELTTPRLEPSHIVHRIRTSEAFARAQNHPENRHLSDADRARKSVRLAANVLKEAKPSGRLTLDGHAMNITGQLTTFGESIHTLHTLRERGAHHREKAPALERIAEFNHAVKDMINENPSLSFREVLSFIMTMNQAINGRKSRPETDAFGEEVRGVLDGMRHEIAFEQMLGFMPDVEYRETTTEEDLQGADIFVSLGGSPMIPLDIKASQSKTQRSKEEARVRGFDPDYIIWSHVMDEDFYGTFRIPLDVAQARSVALHDDIANIVCKQFAPVAAQR